MQFFNSYYKGPVIIYRQGGGGGGFWGGITLLVGEQKGGSFVTENPKEGITENFGRIQRGTTQICLENGDMGGNRESHQMLLGGVTSMK